MSENAAANMAEPPSGIQWKQALGWALYDWANSAFAVTVMSVFVPLFNKDFWSGDVSADVSTFRLGVANSVQGIVMALLAPVLGALADRRAAKKRFLLTFACLGVVMTAGLYWVERGQWVFAMSLYTLASIGFAGGNLFYDSLLVAVARERKVDVVSGLGYALGYVGGGLLFALNVWMVRAPATFGLANSSEAVRWAFLSVAVWWAVFSLPILFLVPEPAAEQAPAGFWTTARDALRQLRATFRAIRGLRSVFLFLLAYWLYIDGVDTVIRMAIDYGRALGLPAESLIVALLIVQFVGFPAALFFGKLGEKVGARTGILAGLCVYILVCVLGYRMRSVQEFYVLAVTVGLVQGGVQALSRSFYARLIPRDRAGEFFGFYNMMGKFATILGPLLMGTVTLWTGDPRLGILALVLLFVTGGALLCAVRPLPAAVR